MSADDQLRYIVCEWLCDLGVFKVLCKSSDDLGDKKERLGVGRGDGVIDDDDRSARIARRCCFVNVLNKIEESENCLLAF